MDALIAVYYNWRRNSNEQKMVGLTFFCSHCLFWEPADLEPVLRGNPDFWLIGLAMFDFPFGAALDMMSSGRFHLLRQARIQFF